MALAVTMMTAVVLVGCAATSSAIPPVAPPISTPCVDPPELTSAVNTLLAASEVGSTVTVYGESGGRRNDMFQQFPRTEFAAMRNPKGAGILVTLVYGGGDVYARHSAHRAGWLLQNGTIYPTDVDAAQAFGLLLNGYPDDVKQSAGLGQNYFGLKAYGVDDFITYNSDTYQKYSAFVKAANQLCAARR
jgi:hypothetical protein